MNTSLLNLLIWITNKYGENILADPDRLKPLIKGYAKNEPIEERVAFGRCIEIGCYNEMKKAQTENDRINTKTKLIEKLHKNTGIKLNLCSDALDLLDATVFKSVVKVQKVKKQLTFNVLITVIKNNMHLKLQNFLMTNNKKLALIFVSIFIASLILFITINTSKQFDKYQIKENELANAENTDKLLELQNILKHQEMLAAQIEQLKNQIETEQIDAPLKPQLELTGQEQLIERLNNELLMEMLSNRRKGMRDITGRILVNIVPINYRNNSFKMNPNNLKSTIDESLGIILQHARYYNQNISFDVLIDNSSNGRYLTLQNATEAINQYNRFSNSRYDFTILIFAIDMIERSYIRSKSDYSHAIMWFRDSGGYSSNTIMHEIYHAFGAEDLYYEQGVVPQEVEVNFKTLIGNSIMLSSHTSTSLDPINAWLIGWNKKPEPWYAWFVDKRDTTNVEFY